MLVCLVCEKKLLIFLKMLGVYFFISDSVFTNHSSVDGHLLIGDMYWKFYMNKVSEIGKI